MDYLKEFNSKMLNLDHSKSTAAIFSDFLTMSAYSIAQPFYTPIDATDRSTKAVFGNYIDIYDIERAVEDGATVKIYYEGRLVKIDLEEKEAKLKLNIQCN